MKTITNLTGELAEQDFREPRGITTTLHIEPAPGIHVKVMLGSAGLLFRRSDAAAALPMADLLKLVLGKCPELTAVTNPPPTADLGRATQAEARRLAGTPLSPA